MINIEEKVTFKKQEEKLMKKRIGEEQEQARVGEVKRTIRKIIPSKIRAR